MVCLGRPHHFKYFKGCLPQISLGLSLNTLTQMQDSYNGICFIKSEDWRPQKNLFWFQYQQKQYSKNTSSTAPRIFWAYPFLEGSVRWFSDNRNPLMVGAESLKLIDIRCLWGNIHLYILIFVSEVFADYFIWLL